MDTDSFTDSEVKSLYILKDRLYWTRLLSLLVPCGCLDCISCHHFWRTAQLGWSKYSRWLHQSQLIFQCGRMWAICAVAVIFYYIKTLIAKKYYVISKLQLLCLYSLFSLFLRCCRFQWFDTLFVVYWHTTCCVGKCWCWEKYPAGCLDAWWVRQWPWTSKVEPFSTSSRDSKWENVKY